MELKLLTDKSKSTLICIICAQLGITMLYIGDSSLSVELLCFSSISILVSLISVLIWNQWFMRKFIELELGVKR